MSYRCEPCGQVVQGHMRRHIIRKRFVNQIEREVQVCADCEVELAHGVTLAQITSRFRPAPEPIKSELVIVAQVGPPSPSKTAIMLGKRVSHYNGPAMKGLDNEIKTKGTIDGRPTG